MSSAATQVNTCPACDSLPAPAEAAGSGLGSAIGAEATDPFFSRNEFKEGFYSQPSQPATTAETMYGKGTKRGFEYPTVDPDTKMMQDAQGMVKGGSVMVKTKLGKNKATKLY